MRGIQEGPDPEDPIALSPIKPRHLLGLLGALLLVTSVQAGPRKPDNAPWFSFTPTPIETEEVVINARPNIQDGPDGVDPLGVEGLKEQRVAPPSRLRTWSVPCSDSQASKCATACRDKRPGRILSGVACTQSDDGTSLKCGCVWYKADPSLYTMALSCEGDIDVD